MKPGGRANRAMIAVIFWLATLFGASAETLLWSGTGRRGCRWRVLRGLGGHFARMHFALEALAARVGG